MDTTASFLATLTRLPVDMLAYAITRAMADQCYAVALVPGPWNDADIRLVREGYYE